MTLIQSIDPGVKFGSALIEGGKLIWSGRHLPVREVDLAVCEDQHSRGAKTRQKTIYRTCQTAGWLLAHTLAKSHGYVSVADWRGALLGRPQISKLASCREVWRMVGPLPGVPEIPTDTTPEVWLDELDAIGIGLAVHKAPNIVRKIARRLRSVFQVP